MEVPLVETFAGTFVSAIYQPLQIPVRLLLNSKKDFEPAQLNGFTICPVNNFVDKVKYKEATGKSKYNLTIVLILDKLRFILIKKQLKSGMYLRG